MRRSTATQAMDRRQAMRWAGLDAESAARSARQVVWHGTRPAYAARKQREADLQLRETVLLVTAWAIIVLVAALAV